VVAGRFGLSLHHRAGTPSGHTSSGGRRRGAVRKCLNHGFGGVIINTEVGSVLFLETA
jgi:hypothetical protein